MTFNLLLFSSPSTVMIHVPTTQGVSTSGNLALPREEKEAAGWGQLYLTLFQRLILSSKTEVRPTQYHL